MLSQDTISINSIWLFYLQSLCLLLYYHLYSLSLFLTLLWFLLCGCGWLFPLVSNKLVIRLKSLINYRAIFHRKILHIWRWTFPGTPHHEVCNIQLSHFEYCWDPLLGSGVVKLRPTLWNTLSISNYCIHRWSSPGPMILL